jgi:hypothetical protein
MLAPGYWGHHKSMHAKAFLVAGGAALALLAAACKDDADGAGAHLGRGYTIDPATGEHRMTIKREDGETTLRAGAAVPVALPEGFSLFPGTRVRENARVTQPGGEGLLLTFEVDGPVAGIADHYRDAAKAAGFAIKADLETGDTRLISAVRAVDKARLTLTATEGKPTTGQLSITAPKLTPVPADIAPWTKPSPESFETPVPQR